MPGKKAFQGLSNSGAVWMAGLTAPRCCVPQRLQFTPNHPAPPAQAALARISRAHACSRERT